MIFIGMVALGRLCVSSPQPVGRQRSPQSYSAKLHRPYTVRLAESSREMTGVLKPTSQEDFSDRKCRIASVTQQPVSAVQAHPHQFASERSPCLCKEVV